MGLHLGEHTLHGPVHPAVHRLHIEARCGEDITVFILLVAPDVSAFDEEIALIPGAVLGPKAQGLLPFLRGRDGVIGTVGVLEHFQECIPLNGHTPPSKNEQIMY